MTNHKPLYILVQTIRLVTEKDFREEGDWCEKVIDYHNPSDRKWLATHSWWAFHNGYSVSTYPVKSKEDRTIVNYNKEERSVL